MKSIILQAILVVTCATLSFGQPPRFVVPLDYSLNEPGDFLTFQRDIILFANWFEGTPLDREAEQREKSVNFFNQWLDGNQKFKIEIDSSIVTFWEKNPPLVTAYKAGWARMLIKSPDRVDDPLSGNLAGLICAMNLYKLGGLKKDKEMEKLIKLVKKNQLSTWVGDQLKGASK
jgi:hypothetical protein